MRHETLHCLGPNGFHRLSYTEWGEMKEAAPILYTYEKGAAGKMNPAASWRPKVVFRSKTTAPYVPAE